MAQHYPGCPWLVGGACTCGIAQVDSGPVRLTPEHGYMTGVVRGRSCLGYAVKAGDIDLMKPIVVLKIDHTAREVHIGAQA
jgi:hypothetical protein